MSARTRRPRRGSPGSEDADSRRVLARRRRRRRLRLGLAWGTLSLLALSAGIGLVLGGNAGLAWIRENTEILEVREVAPGPTSWVAPWEVVRASEVSPGDDILRVVPDSVAARVAALPRVASARVRRSLLRHVTIEIEERVPLALILDREMIEVDGDGVVLGPPPAVRGPQWPAAIVSDALPRGIDLPLITGLEEGRIRPGDRLTDTGARRALALLARIEEKGFDGRGWISEIDVSDPEGLILYTLDEGIPVRVGDGRLTGTRLKALFAALERITKSGESVEYVDARFTGQVIVKQG